MQTVTLSVFRFEGFRNRFWAFTQVGLQTMQKGVCEGLSFAKTLGTGGGNGFSILPNWGVYALLGVWDTEGGAENFENSTIFAEYSKRATECTTFVLQTVHAHGKWDGVEPFETVGTYNPDEQIAVITRATIRPRKLPDFWRFVPSVSRAMMAAEARQYSIGIGELPIVQQATFSIWESGAAMQNQAYKHASHSDVVRRTRSRDWYSEELFARFRILDKKIYRF